MEQTEFSETSAFKIQTPGNYPEEIIQQGLHNPKYIEQFKEVSLSEKRPFVLSKMAY